MAYSQLWSRIGPEKANEILGSVQKTHKKMYGTALELLAPRMKLRAVKVMEMPKSERQKIWSGLLAHPEMEPLNLNLFSEWLGSTQNVMICEWLKILDIPHDAKGFIGTYPACPGKDALRAALDRLLESHPPSHVLIYLMVFNQAPEARWQPLYDLITAEARFPLAPMPEV